MRPAPNSACGRISPSRSRRTISPRPNAGSAQGFSLSRPGLPRPRRRPGRNPAGRHRIRSAAPTSRRRTPKCSSLGLEATAHFGLSTPDIRIGDVGLFAALVAALDLAPAWKRRLMKDFNRKSNLAQDLDRLTLGAANGQPEYQGVLAALAGSDPKAAHALVTDLLSIAGITDRRRPHGRRNRRPFPGAIRARRVRLPAEGDPRADRAISSRSPAIPTTPSRELRKLAGDAKIALDAALDLFETRTAFSPRAASMSRGIEFRLGFRPRHGLLHRLRVRAARSPRACPGRWSRAAATTGCCTRLGATPPIPAVGFSVWIERLAGVGGAR